MLAADDGVYRAAGLSRGKERTIRALAEAVHDGRLDFGRIEAASAKEAVAELAAVHGIGVWTAECYLLFCAGHPDVFPAGDLALQVAAAHAFGLDQRPSQKALAAMAEGWTPHRAVAARLFWAYYAAITRRDAAPQPAMDAGNGRGESALSTASSPLAGARPEEAPPKPL